MTVPQGHFVGNKKHTKYLSALYKTQNIGHFKSHKAGSLYNNCVKNCLSPNKCASYENPHCSNYCMQECIDKYISKQKRLH